MKKFDKGYIYSSLLSDLFGSLVIAFIFLKDFFLNDESNPEDIKAAIPFFVIGFAVLQVPNEEARNPHRNVRHL